MLFVSDLRMALEEFVLSLLLLLLSVLLSLPNLRLLHSILTNNQQPNVFDRGLALCLLISGKGAGLRKIGLYLADQGEARGYCSVLLLVIHCLTSFTTKMLNACSRKQFYQTIRFLDSI